MGLISKRHPVLELVFVTGTLELRNQILNGDEVDRVAGHDGLGAECDGKMCLAYSGRAEEQYVLLALQKSQSCQLAQLAFVDRGLEVEIELIQPLVVREVRPLSLQAHVAGVLGLALGIQNLFKEIEIGQVLGCGFLSQRLEACGQVREPQPSAYGTEGAQTVVT